MRGLRLYGVPLASMVLGVAASLVLWLDIAKWEGRLARSEFDLLAQDRVAVIQNRLLDDIEVVRVVAGFINASNGVTRPEFDRFVHPILKLQPSIRSVEWVDVVPDTYRKQYEKALSDDGFHEGIRRPQIEGSALIRAPKADTHYAVTYVSPLDQQSIPIGFDYQYDVVLRPVLEAARQTTSTYVALVDTLHRVTGGKFVVAVVAVRGATTEVVRGFVVLTIRAEDEVNAALQDLQAAAISISIYDVESGAEKIPLPLHYSPAPVRSGDEVFSTPAPSQVRNILEGTYSGDDIFYVDTMHIGAREIAFLAMPSQSFYATRPPWQSRSVLFTGLLLTAAISLVFHLIGDRSLRAEELSTAREKELHSTRRLADLYNGSPDVMATVVDGVITECNDTMVRTTGLSRAALIGRKIEDLHDPADRRALHDAIARSGHTPHSTEIRLLRSDGHPVQMLLGLRAIVNASGALEVLCVWRDNAELKQTQDDLFKSKLQLRTEERFRLTIEACPNAILVVDDVGQIVMVNGHAERLFGYQSMEMLYHSIEMLMPEEIRSRHPMLLATFFEHPELRVLGGGGTGRDIYAVRQDGSRVPVEIGLAPFDTADGLHAIVSVTDVTKRVAAARALREERDRFQELVVNARSVLWLRDIATGRCVYVSPSYEEMYGRNVDALYTDEGKEDWALAVHPDDRERVRVLVSDQEHDLDVQYRIVTPDGHIRHVWARGRPIPNETGKPERFAGIVEDITAIVRYQLELARSNEDLERFAYVASHDLQEPLRMISGYTQLLAEKYKGKLDDDADEFIGYAVDGAERMQALVNDLLAYSRSGQQRDATTTMVESAGLVAQALENLRAKIQNSDAAIVVPDDMPKIRCVPSQVMQVFQNLISNALKFRQPHIRPEIVLAVERRDQEWCFSVFDNGIGIEDNQREKIFQPFTRVHAYHQYEGSGIGLAICKRVIERLGGRIWVEDNPGGGCAFRFTIPLAGVVP